MGPVHLHLLRTWALPGRATFVDLVRLWPDHQSGLLRGRGANLVLLLLYLDVRSCVWSRSVRNFVHLHLLVLWQFIFRAYSANSHSHASTRERTLSSGSAGNW